MSTNRQTNLHTDSLIDDPTNGQQFTVILSLFGENEALRLRPIIMVILNGDCFCFDR